MIWRLSLWRFSSGLVACLCLCFFLTFCRSSPPYPGTLWTWPSVNMKVQQLPLGLWPSRSRVHSLPNPVTARPSGQTCFSRPWTRRSLLVHVPLFCRGVHFLRPGKNECLQTHLTYSSDAGEEQSHLTSMVTPDIHWCVRLNLVTGPPEKKYHPL